MVFDDDDNGRFCFLTSVEKNYLLSLAEENCPANLQNLRRDRAIREYSRIFFDGYSKRSAARLIYEELKVYFGGNWRQDREKKSLPGQSMVRRLGHAVIRFNRGKFQNPEVPSQLTIRRALMNQVDQNWG